MPDHPPEHDRSSPPPRPESGRFDEATEHLWKTLQAINEWTRFADAKAAAVLTADGVLATLTAGLDKRYWDFLAAYRWLEVLAALAGLALAGSAFVCIKCLLPRLRVKGEFRSLIFFQHIALHPDPATYLDKARALSEPDEAFREVGTQVWANAKVAREKHGEVAIAIDLTGACLVVVGFVALAGRVIATFHL